MYCMLHRLRKDGLVSLEVVTQDDHPDKKVYHITDSGRADLKRWLETPISPGVAPFVKGG
ncbi:MAG: PadR family transcriptional regulator [Chloroflexota bacterium]